jgi:hypothetical protein
LHQFCPSAHCRGTLGKTRRPNLRRGVIYPQSHPSGAYFLVNAAISVFTIWYGDPWLWSLYNGGIFYVLMGLLMVAEMLFAARSRPAIDAHTDWQCRFCFRNIGKN